MDGPTASYVHGVDAHPLVGLTVSELFDEAVRRNPQGEALVFPHQAIRWSWQQLSDEVEALPELITKRTRAVVLVSPANPTGKIFREHEKRALGELARAHDFVVLIDDPYSHFTYENRAHYFNLATVAELTDRLAYLFTFSKVYAMSG